MYYYVDRAYELRHNDDDVAEVVYISRYINMMYVNNSIVRLRPWERDSKTRIFLVFFLIFII